MYIVYEMLQPVIYSGNKLKYHAVHSNYKFIHKDKFTDFKNVNMFTWENI